MTYLLRDKTNNNNNTQNGDNDDNRVITIISWLLQGELRNSQ